MVRFYHCNHSVLDIERSCAFYAEQFGLRVMRQLTAYEGALRLAFLGNDASDFRLELTWNRDRKTPYALGEKEFHVAFYTDSYDALLQKHKAAGIVVLDEPELRLYFVEDPDGYRVEVVELPARPGDRPDSLT